MTSAKGSSNNNPSHHDYYYPRNNNNNDDEQDERRQENVAADYEKNSYDPSDDDYYPTRRRQPYNYQDDNNIPQQQQQQGWNPPASSFYDDTASAASGNNYYEKREDDRWQDDNPPPPPPPAAASQQQQSTSRTSSFGSYARNTPIHYRFKAAQEDEEKEDRQAMEYASPRKDALTKFISVPHQKLLVILCAGIVGASAGGFVGKSIANAPLSWSLTSFGVCVPCAWLLRNPYGELLRSLGLALIWSFQRTGGIRKRYPTGRHIKACIGAGPRIEFPSTEETTRRLFVVVAMGFVGAACGSNLPVVPTSVGGLGGAVFFAFCTTLPSAWGDLSRVMGTRVVSLAEEVFTINEDLDLVKKLGIVMGHILEKLLILDRKHRIKDKIVSVCSWTYDQLASGVSRIQQQDEQPRRPRDEENEKEAGDYNRRDGRRERREESLPPRRDRTRNDDDESRRERWARGDGPQAEGPLGGRRPQNQEGDRSGSRKRWW